MGCADGSPLSGGTGGQASSRPGSVECSSAEVSPLPTASIRGTGSGATRVLLSSTKGVIRVEDGGRAGCTSLIGAAGGPSCSGSRPFSAGFWIRHPAPSCAMSRRIEASTSPTLSDPGEGTDGASLHVA